MIYVEKYTNIDYLEYELDMYVSKDIERKKNLAKKLDNLRDQHDKEGRDMIFNDEEDGEGKGKSDFNEMRETRTGFG